jgi:hypothetical protein
MMVDADRAEAEAAERMYGSPDQLQAA